ncbi:uncharacterized protein LOC128554591 isoform X1 [Mercenaria mercenaria]|uniref:uncharacterized protein LOC128554591 isoform X1 n=1 Tax=Mercenaria mercenaria TaxID=6596 RepID=UPI00234F9F52|nr:uncharacterized protein LOC128554591 isoform X1 [Mercenaria mercenaria]
MSYVFTRFQPKISLYRLLSFAWMILCVYNLLIKAFSFSQPGGREINTIKQDYSDTNSTMMFRILFFLGVITSVSCECPAKQFCFPRQWKSLVNFVNVIGEGNGTVQITPGSAHIFVDDVDAKLRLDIHKSHGTGTLIVLYKEHVGYYIENNKCTPVKPDLKYNLTLCTPENANISKPYLIGYKPSIKAVDYNFHFFVPNAVLSVEDNTAPVSLRMFGTLTGKFSMQSTLLFENFSPTKPNPKVFDVPRICKHIIDKQENAEIWQTLASRQLSELMQ